MEEYVPSPKNRKRWCRGEVGTPHQFRYFCYYPKPAGYPGRPSFFEFRCIACGRRRYTTDEEGEVELEDDGSLHCDETPEPHPSRLRLHVVVDSLADDGSFRRICSHSMNWDVAAWSDERLNEFRNGLLDAAYKAYEAAWRFDLMPPSEAADPLPDAPQSGNTGDTSPEQDFPPDAGRSG